MAKKKSVPKKLEPTRKVRVDKAGRDWKRHLLHWGSDDKEKELRDGDLQAGELFFI